jgi:Protein of unknown function (DUF2510)
MDDVRSAVSLPASWYPDPDDASSLRWWDGKAWTEHVQSLPAPPPARDPESQAITEAFVIKTQIPVAGTWYSETGTRPPSSRSVVPARTRVEEKDLDKASDVVPSWTFASFLLAFLPLIAFVVQYLLWKVGDTPGEIFTRTPVVFWLVPALLIVASPIVASIDRASLTARGITGTPSGLAGVLPPVYLLLRTITVGASSILPLIIWCGLALALYNPISNLIGAFFMQLSQVATGQ